MDDLYRAQLDGYDLEIETLDDQFETAIARYEFPYRDGALLEDLGQKARMVRIRCYFWDDDGDHFTYADHVDFLNHLESRELFELVHPQYGPMKGCVESIAVRHDDRQMMAEVDIAFVENLRGSLSNVEYEDVTASVEEALVDSQYEQMDAFSAAVSDILGAEAADILDRTLDAGQGVLEQFQGISLKARTYLKQVDGWVSTFESTLTSVANPANGIVATINYGTNLPGRVIGALARCIERYVVLYNTALDAPTRFLDNLNQAMLTLESAAVGSSAMVRVAGSAQAAHALAGIYKGDEQTRQQHRQAEQTPSFDIRGAYLPRTQLAAMLTVDELEASLLSARAMLQAGISGDRAMTSLKTMARKLLEHVNTIKLERDKLVTVSLDNTLPLHLICLMRGLPYNYAERIASINQIRNPSFTAGEVRVYDR